MCERVLVYRYIYVHAMCVYVSCDPSLHNKAGPGEKAATVNIEIDCPHYSVAMPERHEEISVCVCVCESVCVYVYVCVPPLLAHSVTPGFLLPVRLSQGQGCPTCSTAPWVIKTEVLLAPPARCSSVSPDPWSYTAGMGWDM